MHSNDLSIDTLYPAGIDSRCDIMATATSQRGRTPIPLAAGHGVGSCSHRWAYLKEESKGLNLGGKQRALPLLVRG